MLPKTQLKIIGLTALGGALEFYDFTIYALFAPYLSQHFFSRLNPWLALINTFAVFALGYLARPLGSLFFGHLGDRYGRKRAFSLAIFLMATATLFMGCLPGYQTIGFLAPLLLMGLRLLQGFSVGGEIPGATVFTLEHVDPCYRGRALGFIFMCITMGNTLGAGMGYLLTTALGEATMMDWGWRLPFILGFLLGIVSFLVRLRILETPVFLALLKEKKISPLPLWELLKDDRKNLLLGFLLTAVSAATISLFLYLPTYLSSVLHLQVSRVYLLNVAAFSCFACMTAFFGWLSDHAGRTRIMLIGALLLSLASYSLFYGLTTCGNSFIGLFILLLASLAGMMNGCYAVTIAELFPARLRYSGMGVSYSLGFALFGGLAPLIFTGLIKAFADSKAPAYYLVFCSLLTLAAVLAKQKIRQI